MRFLVLSVTAGNGHNAMGNAVIEQLKLDGHETKIVDYLRPHTKIRAKLSHEWYFKALKYFNKPISKLYLHMLDRDPKKHAKINAFTYMRKTNRWI